MEAYSIRNDWLKKQREDDTTSGNPLRGMRWTYVCVQTHTSGVTSNMLSAGTSDGFCCSLTALFHKEQKKKYRVLSNFSTTVSYVIYAFILAQHRVLYCTGERGLDENHLLYV